jgi:hypothetical protein
MSNFQDKFEQRHLTIVDFFRRNPFGSNMPILTYLSTLEPLDRCIILENLLEEGVDDIVLLDKLLLACVKIGRPDLAQAVIDFAIENGEPPSNIRALESKLGNITPPPKRNDQERLLMFKNYLANTSDPKEIEFLNLLIKFIGKTETKMTYTEQFIKAGNPLHFIPVPSADTIRLPFHIGSNQYEIRKLLPSGYIIRPSGKNPPGLIIPYLDTVGREYLFYYVSDTLSEDQFGEMRKLVTLREKSSLGEMPVSPENKIGFKNLDMSPDGNYFYSGRDFKGYGAEYLLPLETGGVTYLFPQYARK